METRAVIWSTLEGRLLDCGGIAAHLGLHFRNIHDRQFLPPLHLVADIQEPLALGGCDPLPFEEARHLGVQSDRFVSLNRAGLGGEPLQQPFLGMNDLDRNLGFGLVRLVVFRVGLTRFDCAESVLRCLTAANL